MGRGRGTATETKQGPVKEVKKENDGCSKQGQKAR